MGGKKHCSPKVVTFPAALAVDVAAIGFGEAENPELTVCPTSWTGWNAKHPPKKLALLCSASLLAESPGCLQLPCISI